MILPHSLRTIKKFFFEIAWSKSYTRTWVFCAAQPAGTEGWVSELESFGVEAAGGEV